MLRFKFVVLALISLLCSQAAFSQSGAAFQWIKQLDASGTDSFAGLGVDAQGNTYVAGSTYSSSFPIKAAVQGHLASDGLYRIDGSGSTYAALGLTSASTIAVDPQNPNTLYATSSGTLLRSVDGGVTFSALTLPSPHVFAFAMNPANDKILYAGTTDQGLLRSTDGGATWSASNGGLQAGPQEVLGFQAIWVDPATPNVVLASTFGNFIRSSDGGVNWQVLLSSAFIQSVSFDTANPGTLYVGAGQSQIALKSTDHGQTFSAITTPTNFGSILPDPNHAGRLLGSSGGAIYESDDGGFTWPLKLNLGFNTNPALFVADWASGFLYTGYSSLVRITSDLKTVTTVGPPSVGSISGLTVANGHAYVAVPGTRDVYVTKFDPLGNVVYSTFFGGSADDTAAAMAVDQSGNVYVTGTTTSGDFPVTKGAYASSGGSFLFRLNPDGSLGYSTYFAPPGNSPVAIALDPTGSAYIAGSSSGTLPVTPGAYQTSCNCPTISTGFFSPAQQSAANPKLAIFQNSGFLSKFDPAGATLLYSTYIGGTVEFASVVATVAVAADGTAYVASPNGIYHLNAAGSALLASLQPMVSPQAIALGPDGSLYVAGSTNKFQTTPGAFEPTISGPGPLPYQGGFTATAIGRWDSALANLLAGTYFGGGEQVRAMAFDSAGNLFIGGSAPPQGALPTRTPIQAGFGPQTGFLSELSGDLSTLLFSSYFGDNEVFAVGGLGVRKDGSAVIAGATGQPNNAASPMNVYLNSLTLSAPPQLRLDAVENAASLLDGPISAGETIIVKGAGFAAGAQLFIGGTAVSPTSVTAGSITAIVPASVPLGATQVQVQSGGGSSNLVLVPVAGATPGIFSQDGSGFGQGYILNKDGTLNNPSNPAAPGDPITVFATGVGPVSFTQGYAVTQFPVNVFVDGFYCNGVAAVVGRAPGLPGSVFQITVYVPNPATLVANNPDLANFKFPPLVGLTMQVNGTGSQYGIAISIKQ